MGRKIDGYEFNNFQYGSTSAYGSTVLSENFSLVMSQNWYVSAAFSIGVSLGTLYYSYWNSTESWYVWPLSRFTKYNNNIIIRSPFLLPLIDYSVSYKFKKVKFFS